MRWKIGRYYPINEHLGVKCEDVSIKQVTLKVIYSHHKAQKIKFWHDIPEDETKASIYAMDWDIEFPIVHLYNAYFGDEFSQLQYLKRHLHLDVTIDLACDNEKCVTQELLRGFAKQGAVAYACMTYREFDYAFLEVLI
jgi:hypothetical protein